MDLDPIKSTIQQTPNFTLRRAVERLREGIFDPFAIRLLTAGEDKLVQAFHRGLSSPEEPLSPHLCICGDYGQGKSHSLEYLRQKALADGFVTSLINLDPREIPFHDFRRIYRELLTRIRFPDHEGDFYSRWKSWSEGFAKQEKNNGKAISAILPDEMPHFFRAVLTATAQRTVSLSDRKRALKKHRGYRPREFPWLLKRALAGSRVPVYRLRQVCQYRNVEFYREAPLKCTGPHDYLTQIFCMGTLFKRMGYKGWVVLFDEGESIAQTRITCRSRSYEFLHRFFHNRLKATGLYPVFAFTQDFFFQVKSEDYERMRSTRKGELPCFQMNYSREWQNLTIHQLHDLSSGEWQELIQKLFLLHSKVYDWQTLNGQVYGEMENILARNAHRETRLKMQALVNHLDVIHQEQILRP
ncbi:MAG: ATP-binding protein [Desulfohalobiaceae bacterium]|nr:ATP-binding protein [Desulfohalobiaceae bacterium]